MRTRKTVPIVTLLREGKPVSSRAARRGSFTTGRDWKADLPNPQSDAERLLLLERSFSGWRLLLPLRASAEFLHGSARLSLEEMALWGLAEKGPKGWSIVLRPGLSARFTVGRGEYLLEFPEKAPPVPLAVPAPPALPAGRIPAQLRFNRPSTPDLVYVGLIGILTFLTAICLQILKGVPFPTGVVTIEKMPARISKLLLEAPVKAKPAALPEGRAFGTPEGKGTVTEKPAEKPAPPPVAPVAGQPGGGGAGPGVDRSAIRKKVEKMGVLGILSGKGTAGRTGARSGSAVTALQLDASLEQDLDKVLSEVRGITVAGGGGEGAGPGGGGTGPGTGGGALIGIESRLEGSALVSPVKVARLGTLRGSPVSASGSPKALEPEQREERSTRTIARVVDSHTGAIRYAYNRELRRNPALKGKIILRFTIAPEGSVIECRLEESTMDWPSLETTLVNMAQKWKFPPIPEGVVTVTYPFIFFPSM